MSKSKWSVDFRKKQLRNILMAKVLFVTWPINAILAELLYKNGLLLTMRIK